MSNVSQFPPRTDYEPPHLKSGGDGGNSGGMEHIDIHGRLKALEGANSAILWAVAAISAAMIGGMALIVAI